ncbi:MazG-like family protein [Streptomyces sp. NPDC093252]|uniref:MazG-like family protein n=1 Tax=Streptomyces sp. NPDC093252 TaxID=3154980 RepID=UPI00343027D1
MGERTWDQVGRIREWLDEKAPSVGGADVRLVRVLKIAEEYGEVAEALHGALGTNPRKGHSHTWTDVEKELVDTIVTAMVALDTIAPDARGVFEARLDALVDRVLPGDQVP